MRERSPGVFPGLCAAECGFQPLFGRFLFSVQYCTTTLNRLIVSTFSVSFQELDAYASTL
jgi:hypothetical protein